MKEEIKEEIDTKETDWTDVIFDRQKTSSVQEENFDKKEINTKNENKNVSELLEIKCKKSEDVRIKGIKRKTCESDSEIEYVENKENEEVKKVQETFVTEPQNATIKEPQVVPDKQEEEAEAEQVKAEAKNEPEKKAEKALAKFKKLRAKRIKSEDLEEVEKSDESQTKGIKRNSDSEYLEEVNQVQPPQMEINVKIEQPEIAEPTAESTRVEDDEVEQSYKFEEEQKENEAEQNTEEPNENGAQLEQSSTINNSSHVTQPSTETVKREVEEQEEMSLDEFIALKVQ